MKVTVGGLRLSACRSLHIQNTQSINIKVVLESPATWLAGHYHLDAGDTDEPQWGSQDLPVHKYSVFCMFCRLLGNSSSRTFAGGTAGKPKVAALLLAGSPAARRRLLLACRRCGRRRRLHLGHRGFSDLESRTLQNAPARG